MTVLILPTPNLDDQTFVSTEKYGPDYLAWLRVSESLPSIF